MHVRPIARPAKAATIEDVLTAGLCEVLPGVCQDKCKGAGFIDVPIIGCVPNPFGGGGDE